MKHLLIILSILFLSSPVIGYNHKRYLDYTIDFGKTTRSDKTDAVKLKNPYYWVFCMGIFSGARTNEILQLKVDEIILDDNVWMISIDEEDDKSVKTINGIHNVTATSAYLGVSANSALQLARNINI